MPTKKNTFLIIDGHAVLHRAWHALPPLTTKDGTVVHGAYGFITILLNALKQFSPTCVAVTFDLKGPTFRHEEYEEYKATREKKPDELYAQVPVIERILAAMHIPIFTAKGFEADDVIGTLSKLAEEQDLHSETIIVTGDMDTLQLVDQHTKVFTMRKGMSDTVIYDIAAVKARFGFAPIQMIDYKALRGDPSDNIPGVKGIGEKTATELIATFGSVETLYASLDKNDKKAKALKPAVREKLLMHRKDAIQAKHLCTIKRDVPLEFTLSKCPYIPASRADVESVFIDLDFIKLLKRFEGGEKAPATASLFIATEKKETNAVKHVTDVASLDAALAKIGRASSIAFRTLAEPDDAVAPKIFALGLSDGHVSFIVRGDALVSGLPLLKVFFAKNRLKICHDVKREHHRFRALGISLEMPLFDLMIASYLLNSGERRHEFSALLAYHRGVSLEEDSADVEIKITQLSLALPHLVPLAEQFYKELKTNDLVKLNEEIELPLAGVLAKMEQTGFAADAEYFETLSKDFGKRIEKITTRIYEVAGEKFNINSPAQVKVILFEKLAISTLGLKKTAKEKTLSTAAAELEKLRDAHPIITDILDYRELAKLKSTYVDALPLLVHPKTGRIHAEFNQTVAATGRLASSNPNLQNIPTAETDYGRQVRNGFVAARGCTLIAADYSQIELRLAAHIAKEKTMIDAFKKGEDIHLRTAIEMFGEEGADKHRRIAKVINFGILYGMGSHRLAESTGISLLEAKDYIDRYFLIHKGIAKYIETTKENVLHDGYVETLFGRKRFFRNMRLMNPRERAEAERQAINMPLQGSQADMIKIAMVKIDALFSEKYPEGEARMISQVHDELLFEVKDADVPVVAKEVQELMAGVCELVVPIVVNVSTGKRWGEMQKTNF